MSNKYFNFCRKLKNLINGDGRGAGGRRGVTGEAVVNVEKIIGGTGNKIVTFIVISIGSA